MFNGRDGDFHCINWGESGPLAHISHATGFCAGVYAPLAERLERHLRVVAMDDRGHGKTRAPAEPRKLKDWHIFEADLEHFFEQLREPVIAVGHSRGGVTSLVVAAKRPELVRALVLIDPTIFPIWWRWPWFIARKLGLGKYLPIASRAARRKEVWRDAETILDAYGRKFPFSAWKEGFLEAYIADGTEETGQGNIRLCCDPAWESRCFAVCSNDIWRYVPRVQCPMLVLYGGRSDTFLPAAVKRLKAMAPGETFRCFEQSSHFVPMERPGDTSDVILGFLKDKRII